MRRRGGARLVGVLVAVAVAWVVVVGATRAESGDGRSAAAPSDGVLLIRVLELGRNDAGGGGDAVLVSDSSSTGWRHMLVDAGPAGRGARDPGFVQRRLQALGVDTLEAVVLSHAHSDHFDGLPPILRGTVVRRFYHNGQERRFPAYRRLIALVRSRVHETVRVDARADLALGPAGATRVRILPPVTAYLRDPEADGAELNEGSLATVVRRGSFAMVFTGDGEFEANRRWRTSFPGDTRGVTVLKVGHHGANDAVFDVPGSDRSAWLAHTAPAVHVVSANGVTHPRVRALALLSGREGTRTYCTHVHGDVELRVEADGRYAVSVARNRDEPCVPGTAATT